MESSSPLLARRLLNLPPILLLPLLLFLGCRCAQDAVVQAQQLPPSPLDPVLPVDASRPAGYPVRGVKHTNPTTVSVGSVLDTNEAKETFLKVSKGERPLVLKSE